MGSALKAAQPALANHRVDVTLARDLPLVEFDATLIERVLYNLIENACKYTPPGTVVTVTAEASAGNLVVSVSDTVPGIPKGQEESIFEKFTRGDARVVHARRRPGSRDQPRHRRSASRRRSAAENSPNGGARFTFTLPLGTPPVTPEEATVADAR